jgi:D-alanine-D-alanine ligase-like ATP-grasp enzyme
VDELILEPYYKVTKLEKPYNSPYNAEDDEDKCWIELTVGILEDGKSYHALTPSVTLAQEDVLSVEEKFQGGTGANLTPPPENIINKKQIGLIKAKVEKSAEALGIQGYARIDIFFNKNSNKIMLIEANTLPGLSPSTVIFQQAYLEKDTESSESLNPQIFLSKLIDNGIKRRNRK